MSLSYRTERIGIEYRVAGITGEMKITIEVDTNEDEEVLELIRRLIALLEKEDSNETI